MFGKNRNQFPDFAKSASAFSSSSTELLTALSAIVTSPNSSKVHDVSSLRTPRLQSSFLELFQSQPGGLQNKSSCSPASERRVFYRHLPIPAAIPPASLEKHHMDRTAAPKTLLLRQFRDLSLDPRPCGSRRIPRSEFAILVCLPRSRSSACFHLDGSLPPTGLSPSDDHS